MEKRMNKRKILFVYPKQGMSGSFVKHLPLSILYAAVDSLKYDFEVDMVDVRLNPEHWQENIASKITDDTFLVGFSVMTGTPISSAQEMSRWVRKTYPHLKIVWGGAHATFNGEEIFQDPSVDFVIAGYGSQPLAQLSRNLRGDVDAVQLNNIPGLIFRSANGELTHVPEDPNFEFIDYREIPYHLIENDIDIYGQLDTKERIFSMYSVMGCPYQCTFCSSPAQYRGIRKKYQPLDTKDIVDHIQFVKEKYGASYIYFIDDDSFAKLSHVESIIDEINKRQIKIGMGFRGARINEIKRMSDEFITKLAKAGTDIMHIGAESGSQAMLDLMKKNCTVDDIIYVNNKMSRHPEIKTAYNWLVGIPGETIADLHSTQKLMLRLVEDNPSAILFIPNKFRPLPGTELYKRALDYGYRKPEKLEDWAELEAEGDYRPPWYDDEMEAAINMMRITSYFVDDKINKVKTGQTFKYRFARCLAWLYTPIARLRLKYGVSHFLIEGSAFRMFASYYRG